MQSESAKWTAVHLAKRASGVNCTKYQLCKSTKIFLKFLL
jgi:hypothetical protein